MPLSANPPSGPVTLSANARTVLEKRYLVKNEKGKPVEQPEDLFWRVATVVAEADRVAMHAVRRELVEQQAELAGLPLWDVGLPWPCSNEQYENLMAETCAKALAVGIEGIAFGDLFLEDVRGYREKQLKNTGLEPIFPTLGAAYPRISERNDRSRNASEADVRGHAATRCAISGTRV